MRPRILVALFAALVIIVIAITLWSRFSQTHEQSVQTTISTLDSTVQGAPANGAPATAAPNSKPTPSATTPQADIPPVLPVTPAPVSPSIIASSLPELIIPVTGVMADKLVDTYTQARGSGRSHDAIDIIAPHNAQVVAATRGTIVRLFQSKLGGTTIYELSPDGHTVYYYAHLDHYAEGLAQGERVEQGALLGYVGDTGDAGPGNYHLHFAIWHIDDPKKFWDGENINPYPLLHHVK